MFFALSAVYGQKCQPQSLASEKFDQVLNIVEPLPEIVSYKIILLVNGLKTQKIINPHRFPKVLPFGSNRGSTYSSRQSLCVRARARARVCVCVCVCVFVCVFHDCSI